MNSMTGYGKADLKNKKLAISIEITSVNNRFLEYSFRLPRQLSFLEPRFKELTAAKLNRGKITVTINYEDYDIGIDKLVVNKKLAEEIFHQLDGLKKKYDLGGDIEIGHFLGFSDVFRIEKADDVEAKIWPCMKTAVNRALNDLIEMRSREGGNLKLDLAKRLKMLFSGIKKIEKLCPQNVSVYRERLSQKINNVLGDSVPNANRLEEEIAILAERCDITEECVRFTSHLEQFKADMEKDGPVGKRLNFILQEMNREVNTIGAKAGNANIAHLVVELKEEIEKMREQVQNIE